MNRKMRQHGILVASALAWLLAAPATAANGTLKFWEDTRGALGVTAVFPNGTSQTAQFLFDADTAEGGGLFGVVTGITIRPTGSISFVDFDCHFEGCSCPNDCTFVPGSAADDARVVVDDTVDVDEKHGVWDVGVITFDAGQAPGTIELTSCAYVPAARLPAAQRHPVHARDAAGARRARGTARGCRAALPAATAPRARNARSREIVRLTNLIVRADAGKGLKLLACGV